MDWTQLRSSILADNSDSVLPPTVKLPVLPKALTEFRDKVQDPDATTDELSSIIEKDSGLSTELLKTVNTGATLRHHINSVRRALVVLGAKNTLLHLTNSVLNQVMRSKSSKLINFQQFWNTNLERAIVAREIAILLGADVDLAFTGGMLQDFLLPLITNELFETYLDFTENRAFQPNLAEFESSKFNWDHAQAAAQVMYAWKFPDELICCVYFHHQYERVIRDESLCRTALAAVSISSLVPDALRQEANGMEKLVKLETDWPELELQSLAETVDEEFRIATNGGINRFSFSRAYESLLKRRG